MIYILAGEDEETREKDVTFPMPTMSEIIAIGDVCGGTPALPSG
jgi:hypothetical protein